jgi:hypothetical protein
MRLKIRCDEKKYKNLEFGTHLKRPEFTELGGALQQRRQSVMT